MLASEEKQLFNKQRKFDIVVFVDIHILEAHIISENLYIAFSLFLKGLCLTVRKVLASVDEPDETIAWQEAEVLQLAF